MKNILFGLLLMASPTFSQTETLIWSDEFNGTGAPDPSNWGYDIGNNGWGNNEVQFYTSSTTNARQENGVLKINAIKANNTWTSARLLSKGKREFKYGRIVFRAKLPAGSGTWPALWMLGADISTAGWPACGEIDIMEHVGRRPTYVNCALHTPASYGNTVNKKERVVPTFNTEFHEYQVTWTAQKMDFYIDGLWYYTFNPPVKNASTWPFDKAQFIIINMAMGGNFGSDPQYETNGLKNGIDPALTNATLEVDWVRVYQTTTPTEEIAWPEQLKLMPNPNSGIFTVAIPEGKTADFQLLDLNGAIVFKKELSQKETELDFSNLPKGTYFSQFVLEDQRFTGKVVLQ